MPRGLIVVLQMGFLSFDPYMGFPSVAEVFEEIAAKRAVKSATLVVV